MEVLDEKNDNKFINEYLNPYFKDLFRDLTLRCMTMSAIQEKKLDKVTFTEYCNLPGIINERFFKLFEIDHNGLVSE